MKDAATTNPNAQQVRHAVSGFATVMTDRIASKELTAT